MFDTKRPERTGVQEAVLCESKTVEQIAAILNFHREKKTGVLLTRLPHQKFTLLDELYPGTLSYSELGRIATFSKPLRSLSTGHPERFGDSVAIVCGGTSDLAVVDEAEKTLLYYGIASKLFVDVGVAGLHRLLSQLEAIKYCKLIIAVAGMEAALPTVLSGLVSAPIIAVPVSCGYGVGEGGRAALRSMLASCSPGFTVTNIDNGFGAALFAVKLINTWGKSS